MVTLTPEIIGELKKTKPIDNNLKIEKGVLIIHVLPKSPASEFGLQMGDLIEKINQKMILSTSDVQDQLESKPVGTIFSVELLRQGETKTLEVQTTNLLP